MSKRISKKGVTLVLASTALGLFFLLPAAAQEKTVELSLAQEAQEYAAINAELEVVAKEIASLLKHPGFRGQLRGEINGAKTSESILVLDKFLAKVSKQKKAPPGLAKAQGQSQKAISRIHSSPAWDLDGIDLYFPVGGHKAKWKGNEDLLVAYSPAQDEENIKTIIAYSVKTQQRVNLDPMTPPATPVLMVAPEEHENHDLPVVKRGDPMISEIDEPEDKHEIHFRGNDPEEKPVTQEGGNSSVGLFQMYIRDVKEPWTRGNAEIQVFFGQRKGNYCEEHSKWYSNYPLSTVNDSRRWYTTWPNLPDGSVCGYGNYNYPCWDFDETHYSKMVMYIYERDGGSRRDKTNQLYPGVICTWYNQSGNDYVDSTYMYRNNFPFNYTYGQDLGNAIVRWHKVH